MKKPLISLLVLLVSSVSYGQVRFDFASYMTQTEKPEYEFKWLKDISYSSNLSEKSSISLIPSSSFINRLNGIGNNQEQWVGETHRNIYYLNNLPIESTYEFNTQGDYIGSSFEIKFDKK